MLCTSARTCSGRRDGKGPGSGYLSQDPGQPGCHQRSELWAAQDHIQHVWHGLRGMKAAAGRGKVMESPLAALSWLRACRAEIHPRPVHVLVCLPAVMVFCIGSMQPHLTRAP